MQKPSVTMKLSEGKMLKGWNRANAQNQVNRMLDRMMRKQNHIGELVQEKFALQLLYHQNAHHLQRCKADRELLEYNRDRLYDRYEKWKNKIHAER